MNSRILATGIVLLLLNGQSKAQDNKERLDSLFTAVTADPAMHFSGVVLLADHGEIVYTNAKGYANIANKVLNSDTTRYSLASLSKVFTCIAVMQLKDKALLKLDDPLSKFLPEFPYPNVTIRQLLSHTSGLPDFREIFPPGEGRISGRPLTNQDIIPALKKYGKLVATPGTSWSYSSPAMGLLALLLEKLSGRSFERYVLENICQPARLHHTYVNAPLSRVSDPARAISYRNPGPDHIDIRAVDSVRTEWDNPFQTIIGPGLVVSSAEDLLRFDQALYDDELLLPASRDELFTPVKLSNGQLAQPPGHPCYAGLDWLIEADTSAGETVSHNGGNPGISTILIRNLRTHQTVILLENVDNNALFSFGVNAMNILDRKPLIHFPPMQAPAPGSPPGPPPQTL